MREKLAQVSTIVFQQDRTPVVRDEDVEHLAVDNDLVTNKSKSRDIRVGNWVYEFIVIRQRLLTSDFLISSVFNHRLFTSVNSMKSWRILESPTKAK